MSLIIQIRFALAFLTAANALAAASHGTLKVSANHHYLEFTDGTPFFYLGDTAWELFHRLNRDEASKYLENRASKCFTVIQAVVLSELGGLTVPNANGDLPLIDGDVQKPNPAYFQHVDFIVDKAEKLGLFVGMLPTWGTYWKSPDSIFHTPAAAREYGKFLGTRYRDKPIIWILGGDKAIENSQERATIDALAEGLRAGDLGHHLITFHPVGPADSSEMLNDAPWLDFNMYQSSHAGRDLDNGFYAEQDRKLKPLRPTLDGENRYEEIPVGFYFAGTSGLQRFDDFDVRQSAYWSILAGACGHTYGDNNIWQMYKPPVESKLPEVSANRWLGREGSMIGANVPWYEALDRPGAFQMRYVRKLFESVPFEKLVPDQSMILDGPATGGAKVRAARASDGSFAIIYSPHGESFTVSRSALKPGRLREIWYDPRYGISYEIHRSDHWGIQIYTPPTSGRGQDWVLLLEDASAGFPLPDPN